MKQIRLDNYIVLNIAPKEYHKRILTTESPLMLTMMKIDDYDNFRLPTVEEYCKIYKQTNYLLPANRQYLTSSPITRRIHRYSGFMESQGYVDDTWCAFAKLSPDVYNTVDFILYYIIPVQDEFKPNLLGKLCIQLNKFAIIMSMLF